MSNGDPHARRPAGTVRMQLAFPFEHRPSLDGEDFLVADCNREAVAWLDRWRDWPRPSLLLHGPAACGKTHLGHVFLSATGGRALPASAWIAFDPAKLGDAPAFLIEDVDAHLTPAREEPFLHLYNWLAESNRRLLLTARRGPTQWNVALADLRSRLLAGPTVAIGPPDDGLIAAVTVKLFSDRQIRVDDDVIGYLLARMERSFAAVREVVVAIDAAALAEKRPVTVPLAARVLADMPPSE